MTHWRVCQITAGNANRGSVNCHAVGQGTGRHRCEPAHVRIVEATFPKPVGRMSVEAIDVHDVDIHLVEVVPASAVPREEGLMPA